MHDVPAKWSRHSPPLPLIHIVVTPPPTTASFHHTLRVIRSSNSEATLAGLTFADLKLTLMLRDEENYTRRRAAVRAFPQLFFLPPLELFVTIFTRLLRRSFTRITF